MHLKCILLLHWSFFSLAHCVSGANVANFQVVAGAHSLSTPTGTEQNRGVTRYVMNSAYNANTFANDISLIFVTSHSDNYSLFFIVQ